MKRSVNLIRLFVLPCVVVTMMKMAIAQERPFQAPGMTCSDVAYLHCPDRECSSATVVNQGNVVEMKTRRTYFLDFPCDLKKGEKVIYP